MKGPPRSLFDQLARHALAHVAHRGQAEPDRVRFAREVAVRRVHVGYGHGDLELTALTEVDRGLVEIRLDARQQRREIRHGVIRLQVRRLVGDQRIGGAVRLVEPVAAEELDQVEDLQRALSPVQPALDGPLDELAAALGDDVGLLLGDRLDRGVRPWRARSPQPVGIRITCSWYTITP